MNYRRHFTYMKLNYHTSINFDFIEERTLDAWYIFRVARRCVGEYMTMFSMKPKFDLAAHLATPPSTAEISKAKLLRDRQRMLVDFYARKAQIKPVK